jgi:hypothetical protein
MLHRYGLSVIRVAIFLAILFIILPVGAVVDTTQTTNATPTIPIETTQTNATTLTTVPTTQTANATTVTTVPATQTANATPLTTATSQRTTVTVTQPATTVVTANLTISVTETPTTGSVKIFSSPEGASILIDGVYVGTTPGTVNGVLAGNHILRLTLSGYYDYEGSIYIVPGQTNQGYGTLQPMNQVTAAHTAIPTVIVPVIVPVVTATNNSTAETGMLGNSTVLAAILGVITAIIAAAASVFTHIKPPKK